MLVHYGWESFEAEWSRSVVCIGTFDGVHLGHQKVIRTAVEIARSRSVPSVVVTFDRHPAAVLAPDRRPAALANLGQNLRAIRDCGASVCVVLKFDELMAALSADLFLNALKDRLRATALVVGHDFAFGHSRQGTPEWLQERIETVPVPKYEISGVRVSSSALRSLVQLGEVREARALLGRSFEIEGVVVEGRKLGRQLGFPTANLARCQALVTPADGVYAATCWVDGEEFLAAVSIGLRPTIEGSTGRTIESHLLDFVGSLYGETIRLAFHRRLRPEIKFDSIERLVSQMTLDIQSVRDELAPA